MKMLRRWVVYTLLLLVALLWMFPYKVSPKKIPFSLQAIHTELLPHPEWETHPLNGEKMQEVVEALTQPYHYLGSGGQCYTFVSSDDKYVIKFIKQKAFALPSWLEHCPFGIDWIKRKKMLKKEERLCRVFSAFTLSFEHLSCETGLVFVHLNPTQNLHTILSARAAGGVMHHLDLDATPFVLQKKAVLASCCIDTLVQTGDLEGAKLAIEDLLTLIATLQTQGFRNRDPNFRSNFGFIEGRAALIDVGRLVRSDAIKLPANYKKEFLRTTARFKKYLAERHPQLLEHFDGEVAKILATRS